MSARAFPNPERMYFYYCCSAGGFNKSHICSARRHHKAGDLEARIWNAVSQILKDPGRLRAGLDHMIEQERRNAHGDPATETERWLGQLSEASQKRTRCNRAFQVEVRWFVYQYILRARYTKQAHYGIR